jgi:hypothetical protein
MELTVEEKLLIEQHRAGNASQAAAIKANSQALADQRRLAIEAVGMEATKMTPEHKAALKGEIARVLKESGR